jgi:selenocysteine lyase/cysteine desulfurase
MPIAEPASASSSIALDLPWIRSQFPALAQTINGNPAVFLDGPGGTQVPQRVIEAIADYLARNNANTGGAYSTSRNTDHMIAEARSAMADFLNCDPDEIVFGANMTSLTYSMRPRRQFFSVESAGRKRRGHPHRRLQQGRLHPRHG